MQNGGDRKKGKKVEISQCYRVVQQGKRRVKKQFSSFQDLLNNANLLILVDFYATWYRPCQMMVPVLEQVRVQLRDRLDYKLYTDKIRIDRNYFLQKHDAKYADFLPANPEFPTVNPEFLIAFSQY